MLVIDLYYNERKNVRQIAQEARTSFRDIAAILKHSISTVVVDNQQQQLGNGSCIQENESNSVSLSMTNYH
ncbi:MAG TPA: hypothetical protein VFJ51_02920 [Nitrososphaeraceae archaeon]|nr:hypothetical protein [Nitrososphaeraceae archaeon]